MTKSKTLCITLMVFFLTGCGSDPDVNYLAESMAADGNMTAKESKCLAKGLKEGLDAEQFETFMDMTRADDEGAESPESFGFMMEIIPISLAVSVKCGIPLN